MAAGRGLASSFWEGDVLNLYCLNYFDFYGTQWASSRRATSRAMRVEEENLPETSALISAFDIANVQMCIAVAIHVLFAVEMCVTLALTFRMTQSKVL